MTLAPSSLRELGDAERQRRIGEDTGDDDVFAVEHSHGARR